MPRPTLYVCCPAYALRGPAHTATVLRAAEQLAQARGWQVVPGPSLFYYPGPGAWAPAPARRAELVAALQHHYLWACRGGYGCLPLLPDVLTLDPPGPPPVLLGFSDVTVLHAAWLKRGWGPSYYARLGDDPGQGRVAESLLPLLDGQALTRSNTSDPMARALRPGQAQGPLFAACLAVLAGLCGTPAQPDLRGRILALEDIDERAYRVDFFLEQLFQSGALTGIRGLIGGSFLHQNEPEYQGPTHDEVLTAWAQRLAIPAISRLPFGHLADALTLPNGRQTTLDVAPDDWRLAFHKDNPEAR
ncbi:MAG: LD-carboxypeptidase [Candidatus Marinimicrobia bacterium]|nr:LD-carboxypeptidase [Candidatus Neomarinimicrobiota bacterium]